MDRRDSWRRQDQMTDRRYQRPQQSWSSQFQELDLYLKGINPGILLHLSREDDTLKNLLQDRNLDSKTIKLLIQVLAKMLNKTPISQIESAKFVMITFLNSADFILNLERQLKGDLEYDSGFIKAVLTVMNIVLTEFPKQHVVNVFSQLHQLVDKIIKKRYTRNEELNALNKTVFTCIQVITSYHVKKEDILKDDINKNPSDFRTLDFIPHSIDFDIQKDVQDRAARMKDGYPSVDHYLDFLFRLTRADMLMPFQGYLSALDESDSDSEVVNLEKAVLREETVQLKPVDTKKTHGESINQEQDNEQRKTPEDRSEIVDGNEELAKKFEESEVVCDKGNDKTYVNDDKEEDEEDDPSNNLFRLYTKVRIARPVCMNKGLGFQLSFDLSKPIIKERLLSHMAYGWTLLISHDGFDTFRWATVEDKDIYEGLVNVRFIPNSYETTIEMFLSILNEKANFVYTVMEAKMSGAYDPSQFVLSGIKHLSHENLRFWKYVGKLKNKSDIPEYLKDVGDDVTYDLYPLIDDSCMITDDDRWNETQKNESVPHVKVRPADFASLTNVSHTNMDSSQLSAVQSALTKEFSLISGPPATGKTTIALNILKVLLYNKQVWQKFGHSPLLIVFQANKKLDDFLEEVLTFFQGKIVRGGSKTNRESIEEFTLVSLRQDARRNGCIPKKIMDLDMQIRRKMNDLRHIIMKLSTEQEVLLNKIDKGHILRPEISEDHFFQLSQATVGSSVIPEWLGVLDLNHTQNACVNKTIDECLNRKDHDKGQNHVLNQEENTIFQPKNYTCDNITMQLILETCELMNSCELSDSSVKDLDKGIDDCKSENQTCFTKPTDDTEDTCDNVNNYADTKEHSEDFHLASFNLTVSIDTQTKQHVTNKGRTNQDTYFKKKYELVIKKHIESPDVMPVEEASQICNLWDLSIKDRWRLYRFWKDRLFQTLKNRCQEFDRLSKRQKELLFLQDKAIFEDATIIAMTTTVAAKYQTILQDIGPTIVIAQDAEILSDSDILLALTPKTEHVILIGNHQGHSGNQNTSDLGETFSMDVSLHTRMIKDGFEFDLLKYQHRMHPDMTKLLKVPGLYPDVLDFDSLTSFPLVKGMNKNVQIFLHDGTETLNPSIGNFQNLVDALHITEMLMELLGKDYTPNQISILSPFTGQIDLIRVMLEQKSKDLNIDLQGLTVSPASAYAGHENDIILFSLNRSYEGDDDPSNWFHQLDNILGVALSRAKIGLYIFGSYKGVSKLSPTFQGMFVNAVHMGIVGLLVPKCVEKNGKKSYCYQHFNEATVVKTMDDFKDVVKNPKKYFHSSLDSFLIGVKYAKFVLRGDDVSTASPLILQPLLFRLGQKKTSESTHDD